MLLGVSEWVSRKMNYEVGHIRLAFIIFALLGFGILLYLILFVLMLLEK
jgi:phage shock protein PspC (stress-responsive transcriptional regulator)